MSRFDIHSTLKVLQTQNGLRHSDYTRYRRYCSKKLRRIRTLIGLKFGRGRFQQHLITEEQAEDSRFFFVVLLMSERAWAHAMQLRQHLSIKPSSKSKQHLIRKLKKAAKYAEQLESLTTSKANVKTSLEAQAYRASMQGNLNLELQSWDKALEQLMQAQAVYERLAEVADQMEAVVFNDKLHYIEPMIKYCQHHLGYDLSTEELVKLRFGDAGELLNAQVDSLLAESRKERIDAAGDFEIGGRRFTIKDERARIALRRAEEVFLAMGSTQDKLQLFSEAFNHYEEAARIIKKERDEAQAAGEVSESLIWNQVLEAIGELRAQRTVERNIEIAKQAEGKFVDETDVVLAGGKPKNRPQEVVKAFDVLLNSLRQVGDQQNEMQYRGKRAYYMSLVYLYNERLLESYALLQRAIELGNMSPEVEALGFKLQAAIYLKEELPDLQGLSLFSQSKEFPPAPEPVPCKPVFFDLASDWIKYPNLSEKTRSQGFLSKTWSRFFGR